jgi:hypothetical protein
VVYRNIKLGETSLDIHVQQPVTLLRSMFQGDSPVARLRTPDAAMGPPHEHGVIEDLVVFGRILWLPPGLTLPDGAVGMRRPLKLLSATLKGSFRARGRVSRQITEGWNEDTD